MDMPLIIGTSGWQYRHWRDVLYPPGVPQRRWLEHYAERYATVENDGTFYRLPARETFADWRSRTPAGFVMAVKASRYLTHIRRLKDPAEPVARLLAAAAGLGDRLGPILVQLPPSLTVEPGRLDECLAAFETATDKWPKARGVRGVVPSGPVKVAVEPRHASWWTDEIKHVLTAHGAALCLSDRRGRPTGPLWRTTGWSYLRLHEGVAPSSQRGDQGGRPPGPAWPRYGPQALRRWIGHLVEMWPDDETPVYVYFNNDQNGAAIADAAEFARLAREAGRTVAHTPSSNS